MDLTIRQEEFTPNNAWSPWDLDGHAFIRHADYNISILESDWTRSAKGQYYYNHEIDYGVVERSISAQIMQWEAVSTLVDCSFYEDKYIQLRASQATSFKGKVRVVYIKMLVWNLSKSEQKLIS